MVEIEFNLMLIDLAGAKSAKLDIGGSIHLNELAGLVGLKEDDIGMLLINKKWAPLDCYVNDGDYVQLFPYLEGG